MTEVWVLNVLLNGEQIGTLTRVSGDRSIFAFTEQYIADENRPTLGLRFKDTLGELITEFRPYQTRVMPFFSNLLPEEQLRIYLAKRAGVSPQREFFLLWVLGSDLPGAIVIRPADGEAWPPEAADDKNKEADAGSKKALRFSLAGVQLKFSALAKASGGLTIPVHGVGGSWIVKLPSEKFDGVPENEFSMMTLARLVGIDVPAIKLVDVNEIENLPEGVGSLGKSAFAIQRFDRLSDGSSIHIEDFAQVFDLFSDDKYHKASYVNIASVIGQESGDDDVREFIKRLTFSTLIGNADMHLKNWSLMYSNRREARLSPAYDLLSTIPYIPDDEAALKFSRTKRFDQFNEDELSHLAARARLPKLLVLDAARETVALFHEAWRKEQANLPLGKDVVSAITGHLNTLQLAL